ncbi:hypothetical protein KGY79_01765 [Candidatus Bipolaricaulota bacterium]|nr:hypothetical protein [Candidatus Bipolaricaulota bacterium]
MGYIEDLAEDVKDQFEDLDTEKLLDFHERYDMARSTAASLLAIRNILEERGKELPELTYPTEE